MVQLPDFITMELTGPYGLDVSRRIRWVQKKYESYLLGADFANDFATEGEEFGATVLKSKKIKRLIDQEAEFMVGKTPEYRFEFLPGKGEEIEIEERQTRESDARRFVENVLKKNRWDGKLMKGAKDCFIGGMVALKIAVDERRKRIIISFAPADAFVYETLEDDIDTMVSFTSFSCTCDSDQKEDQRWWKQRYHINSDGKVMLKEGVYDGWGQEIDIKADLDTGLDRIPVYVICNDGLSGDLHGESDVDMIEDEDRYYNKMRSQNVDTTRKSMNPINYIVGASEETFEGLSTAPGAINDIQPSPVMTGANGATLPHVGSIASSFGYSEVYDGMLSNLDGEMHANLGVPDVSSAKTSGLVTSGKGLKALYWPLICRCNEKWTAWRPALEWLAETILYIGTLMPDLQDRYGHYTAGTYIPYVDNAYPLPEDEAEERTLDLKEVGVARSMKSYLMEWGGPNHKGLSADDADREVEQIIRERRMSEESYEGDDI